MEWDFPRYIQQILEDAKEECKDRKTSQICSRALDLRDDSLKDTGEITPCSEAVSLFSGKEEELRRIWRYSRAICRGMERWGRNLRSVGIRPPKYEEGKCSPGGTGYGGSRQVRGQQCKFEKNLLKWDHLSQQQQLLYKEQNHRSLSACMDIVTQIMGAFDMTSTKMREVEDVRKKSPCQLLYKSLVRWGGDRNASRIMEEWFISSEKTEEGNRYFTLTGRDLYEIISEFLYGDDAGDKALGCEKEMGHSRNGQEGEVTYNTTTQSQRTLGNCQLDQDTCWAHLEDVKSSLSLDENPDLSSTEQPTSGAHEKLGMDSDNLENGGKQRDLDKPGSPTSSMQQRSQGEGYKTTQSGGSGLDSLGSIIGGVVTIVLGGAALYGYYRIFPARRRKGLLRKRGGSIILRIPKGEGEPYSQAGLS
ncbi:hypothetical protein C922_05567 [Plasmodium inui San Antonio 1]|uniref:Uncharacterized protein n=1 Tax=Plasmodium inui San Antonio 1 TaxID=1237626 RepID=W7AFJ6_9APIC|nr:hypothetical protein C922_05567 [Plasmodium inui San Antonio 1]EUD64051.1 hypothetical protein C922_05567 [Plasmodium inui San Antonio 1]